MQSVAEQKEKHRINARAEALSNAERGSVQFLSSYRRARTEICKELSREDRERYEELADKWNREPVPPMVQRESALLSIILHLLNHNYYFQDWPPEILCKRQWSSLGSWKSRWAWRYSCWQVGGMRKEISKNPSVSSVLLNRMYIEVNFSYSLQDRDSWTNNRWIQEAIPSHWQWCVGGVGQVSGWNMAWWDIGTMSCYSNFNHSLDESNGASHDEYDDEELPSRKGRDSGVPWDLQTDGEGWSILPVELSLPLPQLKEILCSFLTITYREYYKAWSIDPLKQLALF